MRRNQAPGIKEGTGFTFLLRENGPVKSLAGEDTKRKRVKHAKAYT